MGKFDGYLLVADFDGTLRPYRTKEVPGANLDAAERFMAEGGLFTLATGRSPFSYMSIRHLFTVNAPVVLSNGAEIFDPESGENLYESFLPFCCREDMKALLEAFPEVGLEVMRGMDVRVVRSNANLEEHLSLMGAAVQLTNIDHIMFPWTRVCLLMPMNVKDDPAFCRALTDFLAQRSPGAYDAVATDYVLDVAAAGNDKGSGVEKLASFMDIARERVICVGDGWNDIPMLRFAGRAFAPECAVDEVKALSGITVVGETAHCLADIVDHLSREIG